MSEQQTIACPVCRSELSIAQLFMSEAAQNVFTRLLALGVALGEHLAVYLTLHTPPKSRLTLSKQLRLIEQLLPDMERHAITRAGREWEAPPELWIVAMEEMQASRSKLVLPLTGHSYLYSVMQTRAERREARLEAQREEQRRTDLAQPRPQPRTIPQQSTGISPLVRQMRAATRPRQHNGETS